MTDIKALSNSDPQHADLVWIKTVDNRWEAEVQRQTDNQGLLCIFDSHDNNKLVSYQKVSISFTSEFESSGEGTNEWLELAIAEMFDFASWCQLAIDFVDSLSDATKLRDRLNQREEVMKTCLDYDTLLAFRDEFISLQHLQDELYFRLQHLITDANWRLSMVETIESPQD